MTRRRLLAAALLGVIAIASGVAIGQPWYGRGRGRGRRPPVMTGDRNGVPNWTVDKAFKKDVFTFVRVKYDSWRGRWGGGYLTDFPDSDLNFSFRLQQLTSL